MHILFVFLPIILLVTVIRLITLPFRIARRHRYGNYYGYDRGYNPYGNGYRHRHRFGGIGTILALVALDRIFTGRRF